MILYIVELMFICSEILKLLKPGKLEYWQLVATICGEGMGLIFLCPMPQMCAIQAFHPLHCNSPDNYHVCVNSAAVT